MKKQLQMKTFERKHPKLKCRVLETLDYLVDHIPYVYKMMQLWILCEPKLNVDQAFSE
jgi:hypothetical protein